MIKNLQNKPRVFLSHSKKDKEFIHRLCKDLRSCQIEPWLDSQEIRHGQPWLDEIFESGIPTCDAILVYLTENSVGSPMVRKEIDASILEKLKESHAAFLPYVSMGILRDQLRLDIQALQTPIWNKENYAEMLPRVIAEIWHSFLDRRVISVASDEKLRRLEAELELERLKNKAMEGIFDARENAEFEFIWKKFDTILEIHLRHLDFEDSGIIKSYYVWIEIQTIIPKLDLLRGASWNLPSKSFSDMLKEAFHECHQPFFYPFSLEVYSPSLAVNDLLDQFRICGLITVSGKEFGLDEDSAIIMPTDKLNRFKFWLYYKGILPNEIKWESIDK